MTDMVLLAESRRPRLAILPGDDLSAGVVIGSGGATWRDLMQPFSENNTRGLALLPSH